MQPNQPFGVIFTNTPATYRQRQISTVSELSFFSNCASNAPCFAIFVDIGMPKIFQRTFRERQSIKSIGHNMQLTRGAFADS